MKRALIITGGNNSRPFLKTQINKVTYDYIIGVDSGCNALYDISVKPDIMVGDFDSINPEVLKYFKSFTGPHQVNMLMFDAEKDFTDTELALKHLLEVNEAFSDVHILGATGSRIDHMLSTVMMLSAYVDRFDIHVIDENHDIRLLKGPEKYLVKKDLYDFFTLISLTDQCTGVTYKHAKYSLNKAIVKRTDSVGISNEWIEDVSVDLSVEEGICLLFRVKE